MRHEWHEFSRMDGMGFWICRARGKRSKNVWLSGSPLGGQVRNPTDEMTGSRTCVEFTGYVLTASLGMFYSLSVDWYPGSIRLNAQAAKAQET